MIVEIQYLRAIAAIMVVLFHSVWQLNRMNYAGPDVTALSAGVDIFFVISGFVMVYIAGRRPLTPATFMRDRIFRIVPLYWILTSVIAVAGLVAPAVLQSSAFDLSHFLASLAFVPAIHPVNGGIFPLHQLGWTLNYEMYFYVVFAVCLLLPGQWRFFTVVAAIIGLAYAFSFGTSTAARFYANPIVIEFGFGVLLGWLYGRHPGIFAVRRGVAVALTLVVVGFAAIFIGVEQWPDIPRFLRIGLPSVMILAGALVAAGASRRLMWPFAALVGDASYSLYLSHTITLSAFGQISHRLAGDDPGLLFQLLFMAGAVVICIIVALFVHEWIDRPIQRRLKALAGRSPRAGLQPAA